jgi:hypothetical protein
MGIVIPYPGKRPDRPQARTGEGCHVVIFPGVRIEREGNRPIGLLRRPDKPVAESRKPTKSA